VRGERDRTARARTEMARSRQAFGASQAPAGKRTRRKEDGA